MVLAIARLVFLTAGPTSGLRGVEPAVTERFVTESLRVLLCLMDQLSRRMTCDSAERRPSVEELKLWLVKQIIGVVIVSDHGQMAPFSVGQIA